MAGKIVNGFEACMQELAEARCTLQELDKRLFPCGGPEPKTLIEISGASGNGKSLLLHQLMARCLIGRKCDVIFIDMSHKFDVSHFELVLRRELIESMCAQQNCAELDALVEQCLECVRVLSCYASSDYTVALETTETTLLENANCALLAIDGLDAFYWLDAYECPLRMHTHYARNVERLRRLCQRHNVCCAYTVDTCYVELKQRTVGQSRTKWLPPVQVDYRLQLQRAPNGGRSLNGAAFSIADDGIHFEMAV